jgi:LuxR family maltose regulon positive regulatory protein
VERPELTGLLAGTATRLVLVDAPAGFGKTALVAQWRSSVAETRSFAWVSLDRGDNDLDRMCRCIGIALQRACPEIGVGAILDELRGREPDIAGVVLPALVSELTEVSAPVVLVLDDYHVIKERASHDHIAFLLLHLPPSAQIVLITRADPPLPLARLRAAGEMTEIRPRELRFTTEEAAKLLHTVSRVELSEADLADLVERTEGWPAGLYLAALSLRDHPAPSTFVRQFTGNNRFIFDYLADEVIGRQSGQIRQFLTRTSVLERFCAPLCEAVTGLADAAGIIDVLERENIFLVPLDDSRQWYRHHHLFAQVLRSQLTVTEPDIVPELHERASAWHQQAGSAEEAIYHAFAADDIANAVDLIARHWYPYIDIGRTSTVREWMRMLGDERIAARPLAAHAAAWAAALSGDRESAYRWLPVIEAGGHEGPLPDGMRSLKSSAALLRGVYGFNGLRVMRESAALAAEMESDPASPWHALAKAALGFSLYLSGETTAAVVPLEEAVQSEASVPLIRMPALCLMSLAAVQLGALAKARELAAAAHALADRSHVTETAQTSLAYLATGAVHAALGQLDEARRDLERALESRRKVLGINPWPTLEAALALAQVRLDLGDHLGAAESAAEARQLLTPLPDGTEALQSRLAELDRRITARPREIAPGEPLTEREAAVLRLLGGTLSLREIGQELYVSANTVKTHTQAIYRKLGVSTRHDAVEQGKRLDDVLPCAVTSARESSGPTRRIRLPGAGHRRPSCLARRTASPRWAAASLR